MRSAAAEHQPIIQNQEPFDRELRIRTDTETWLAETLNGNMRTSFEYSFDGQELYGEDGSKITQIFDDSIQAAEIITHQNPSLSFELRRRLIERGELDDMKDMAKGELFNDAGEQVNTIVVLSDFPPELMDSKDDIGGYNTNRKQTMMRVITLEESGAIKVTTQSLDGSNREALESIGASLGKQFNQGELLEQRIGLNLSAERQPKLVDSLTAVYDESLAIQHGGDWYAGRRPANDSNTYDFVRSQQDLVNMFTANMLADPKAAEKLRYNVAATIKARHQRHMAGSPENISNITHASVVTVRGIAGGQSLSMEMEREGRLAASRGEDFSGCGVTSSAEEEAISAESQLSQSGYGNKSKSKSDDDCEFMSKECPECHEKNVWTKVTKTHVSGSCGCSKKR